MEKVEASKLFKYSKKEDYLNYISHLIGAILSPIAIIYLLMVHKDITLAEQVSVIIYGFSMFLLFGASALYHHQQDPQKRAFLKRLDHAMILVMISGTYVPFCIIMNSKISHIILFVVYVLSFIGIMLKVKYINVRNSSSIMIYLIVGWLAIFMMKDIINFFDIKVIMLMVIGGIVYSLGALIYAFTDFEYQHALWHVFVLVAAIVFFFAINFALYV